jgi:hypothetical protein
MATVNSAGQRPEIIVVLDVSSSRSGGEIELHGVGRILEEIIELDKNKHIK